MKINLEFEDWDELCNFLAQATATPMAKTTLSAETVMETLKKDKPIAEKAPEKPETAETAEPVTEKAAPVIEEPAPAVDAAALKVELRKLLAKVNKKTGTNTASEWIKELAGKDKLTEVDDPEALTALKAKAEEALDE